MSTYQEVIDWCRETHGVSVAPCYVSEMKARSLGLPHPERNRDGSERKRQKRQPMQEKHIAAILKAFDAIGIPDGKRHFAGQ